MKKFKGKWNEILYVFIIIAFTIMFLVIHFNTNSNTHKSLYDGIDLRKLTTDWHLYVGDESDGKLVYLPDKFNVREGDVVTVKRNHESITDGMALCFKTEHTGVRVIVDGVEIYSHGWVDIPLGHSLGSKWHIVELTKEYKNKPIELQFRSYYENYAGVVPAIMIGSVGDANLYVEKNTVDTYILSYVSLILGILLMGVFILTRKLMNVKQLIYLGVYMVVNAFWGMAESGYLQFSHSNDFSSYVLKNLLFLLMPLAMVMALKPIGLIRKHFSLIYASTYGVAVLVVAMQLLGIYDFYEMIHWIHIVLLGVCTLIFYDNYHEYQNRKNKNFILVFIAIVTLMACVVWDMIVFYTFADQLTGYYIRLGAVAFVIILGVWAVGQAIELYREGTKKEIYADMAYTDTLTGLYNRRAFDEDLRGIESARERAVVVMIDLNNLKTINDKLGHQSGDNAIKAISRRIKRFTDQYGEKCYRTGGDEFCVICKRTNVNDIIKTCESINAELFESREVPGAILSMAYGYKAYDPYMYDTIEQVVMRADEMMYAKKQQMKAEMAARAAK